MDNLIVIERDSESSISWPNLEGRKKIPDLSVKELIHAYQGFEGELITSFSKNDGKYDKEKIINFRLRDIENASNYIILYLTTEDHLISSELNDLFIFSGYDYGICEEEATIYSSIYNEILFGEIEELVNYKNHLNNGFIFPEKSIAENYTRLHRKLLLEGRDVEHDEEMKIYGIFNYRNKLIS